MHNVHLLNYNELQLDENTQRLRIIEVTKNSFYRISNRSAIIAEVFDLYLLLNIEKVSFYQRTHAITAHQENSVLNLMIAHSRFAMHKLIMHNLSVKFYKLPSFFCEPQQIVGR